MKRYVEQTTNHAGVLVDPAAFISGYPGRPVPGAGRTARSARPGQSSAHSTPPRSAAPASVSSTSAPSGISARAGGVIVLLLLVSGLLLGAQVARANDRQEAQTPVAVTQQVTVQAGDSLWLIVRRVHPFGDIRGVVADIVAARGSSVVQAGEVVNVPGSLG